ncbi:hypothetical protein HIM_06002 [Hirsutella minnesotensis 3608]|uniref:DNA-binding protein RAP1 n=1 Tax=Hirsutella minnesotensis 3608 TaxID=1043627 RepID=A0A0F7ZZQ9_9HYPO|nr:hypothetical protein HIM_06002 [Hirsutella minnesotensis 3608]
MALPAPKGATSLRALNSGSPREFRCTIESLQESRQVQDPNAWPTSIPDNGGVIEILEKNSDMLIADGARKDAPAGSYSWKFITESIERGARQLPDHYRIGPDPNVPRPAGSGGPRKATRTPFTHRDDVILCKWLVQNRADMGRQKIYTDLEQLQPHHTWQSWKNRYSKTLMQSGWDNILRLANEELPAVALVPPPAASQAPPTSTKKPSNSPLRNKSRQPSPRIVTDSAAVATTQTIAARNEPAQLEPSVKAKASPPATPDGQEDDGKNVADEEDDFAEVPFYAEFDLYCEANYLNIKKDHLISGKTVGLWELCMAILDQHVPFSDINWLEIAYELSYDSPEHKQAGHELKRCFQENCEVFLEDFMKYRSQERGSEGPNMDGEDEDEAQEQTEQDGHGLTSEHIRSSPPIRDAGRKRSLDVGSSLSSPSAKRRRRLSRDAEIPSTPDHKIGLATQPRFFHTPSRSVRRNIVSGMDQHHQAQGATGAAALSQSQNTARQMSRTEEIPDSQVLPPLRQESQRSQYGMTPSQQLRSEALSVSPIPLKLTSKRAHDSPRSLGKSKSEGAVLVPPANIQASRRSLPASFASVNRPPSRPVSDAAGRQQQPSNQQQAQDESRPWATGKDNKVQIAQCVEYYESLGYPNHVVVEALKRTTMTPGGLAAMVMQSLQDGQGVPTHHEGVWTDRDDQGLLMVDQVNAERLPAASKELRKAKKEFERLTRKHGLDRIEVRRQFLEAEATSQ